jgi:hypothetical protein
LAIDGQCAAITRIVSQLFSLKDGLSQLFLNSIQTTTELYARIDQGKLLSTHEQKETFALSQLIDQFNQELDTPHHSLPINLITQEHYKTYEQLSAYLSGLTEDFAIHLVTTNHVVAIYHHNNQYTYFDSNIAYISGIKTVPELMHVLKEAIQQAGYKFDTKGFLVERFNVHRANQQLTAIQKRILTTEIQTERQRLMQQDKTLGPLTINGQEITRVQLYDLGTKVYLENTKPLSILIHADMQLDQEKLNQYLQTKKIELTARDYLNTVRKEHHVELVRITQTIPFGDGAGQTTLTQAQEIQAAAHDPKKLKTLIQTQRNKNLMLNTAGRITFLRGIHGAFVSCGKQRGKPTDCALNLGEIGYALVFPRLIGDRILKRGDLIERYYKKPIKIRFAKAGVGAGVGLLSGLFEIIAISIAIDTLQTCQDEACIDAIAQLVFASAALSAEVVCSALSAPGPAIIVGLIIVVVQSLYQSIRTLQSLEPYNLTPGEKTRAFFRTLLLMEHSNELKQLIENQAHLDRIGQHLVTVLTEHPELSSYAVGLGNLTERTIVTGFNCPSIPACIKKIPDIDPAIAHIITNPLANLKGNDTGQSFLARQQPGTTLPNDMTWACWSATLGLSYEYGFGTTLYRTNHNLTDYCFNALMLQRSARGTHYFDLTYINRGIVVGRDASTNLFQISGSFYTTTQIMGGNDGANNTYVLDNRWFEGAIWGGNASNVIVLKQAPESLTFNPLPKHFNRVEQLKKLSSVTESGYWGIEQIILTQNQTLHGHIDHPTILIQNTKPNTHIRLNLTLTHGTLVIPGSLFNYTLDYENEALILRNANTTIIVHHGEQYTLHDALGNQIVLTHQPDLILHGEVKTHLSYQEAIGWHQTLPNSLSGKVLLDYPGQPHLLIGTSDTDYLPIKENTWYASGKAGSDLYHTIEVANRSVTTEIDNDSEDLALDQLVTHFEEIQIERDQNDLHLHQPGHRQSYLIKNFLREPRYQHLIVYDANKKSWFLMNDGTAVPFYSRQSTISPYTGTIVLDSALNTSVFYRDGDGSDLIVIDPPGRYCLTDYYEQNETGAVLFYRDNETLSSEQLQNFAQLAIDLNLEIQLLKTQIQQASNQTLEPNDLRIMEEIGYRTLGYWIAMLDEPTTCLGLDRSQAIQWIAYYQQHRTPLEITEAWIKPIIQLIQTSAATCFTGILDPLKVIQIKLAITDQTQDGLKRWIEDHQAELYQVLLQRLDLPNPLVQTKNLDLRALWAVSGSLLLLMSAGIIWRRAPSLGVSMMLGLRWMPVPTVEAKPLETGLIPYQAPVYKLTVPAAFVGGFLDGALSPISTRCSRPFQLILDVGIRPLAWPMLRLGYGLWNQLNFVDTETLFFEGAALYGMHALVTLMRCYDPKILNGVLGVILTLGIFFNVDLSGALLSLLWYQFGFGLGAWGMDRILNLIVATQTQTASGFFSDTPPNKIPSKHSVKTFDRSRIYFLEAPIEDHVYDVHHETSSHLERLTAHAF